MMDVKCPRSVGRSVERSSPARASRTLERARTARPPCLPFSPPLCPPRRPPRYVSLDSNPPAAPSNRSRVYPRDLEPRATPRCVDRRATRARRCVMRARAKEYIYIYICPSRVGRRAHRRVVLRASTTTGSSIHPSARIDPTHQWFKPSD